MSEITGIKKAETGTAKKGLAQIYKESDGNSSALLKMQKDQNATLSYMLSGGMGGIGAIFKTSSTSKTSGTTVIDNKGVDTSSMSEKQNKMWGLAQNVSKKTGMSAKLIYAQWYHESGGFESQLSKENYNFAGITQIEANDSKQPDGSCYYKRFDSPEAFAEYYADFIPKFDGATTSKSPEELAQNLRKNGYFTDKIDNYVNGLKGGLNNLPTKLDTIG